MAQFGIWNSKGGVVLNKYLVARVFAFDDHASEARAACVAKGWEDVGRPTRTPYGHAVWPAGAEKALIHQVLVAARALVARRRRHTGR